MLHHFLLVACTMLCCTRPVRESLGYGLCHEGVMFTKPLSGHELGRQKKGIARI